MKFNEMMNGNICIEGPEYLVSSGIAMSTIREGQEYFIRKTNIEGIYTYGIKSLTPDPVWDKPAGYIWASRASVMNRIFDTCLRECYYRKEGTQTYTCGAIDLVRYEQFLKENGYEVDFNGYNPYPSTNEDLAYEIKKINIEESTNN